MEFVHKPIMLEETIRLLRIDPKGTYVDGTLGGGGHSFAIARQLTKGGRLVGIDQDGEAIQAASGRLAPFADRVRIVRSNFSQMRKVLEALSIEQVDGILLDLGVSSHQLDDGDRGFTYREDVPLDMRMDQRQEKTARDIVNGYREEDLARVIRQYGEEHFAKNIARQIVRARQTRPLETTGQLADLIRQAIPQKYRVKGGHPAKRTFQAIRIELNQELTILENHLEDMVGLLGDGGRICVITFHSLEDRIVKKVFRTCENPCICPPDFPVCTCGRTSMGRVITRKPVRPGPDEIRENSRASSAKLRAFERIWQ